MTDSPKSSTAELTVALTLAREILARRGALNDYAAPGNVGSIGQIIDRALGWTGVEALTGAKTRAPLSPALDAATRLRRKRARRLSSAREDLNILGLPYR